ncbi:MAG: hypothetical protein JO061_00170 [Acidobacteriaceae bacterium]|nr:hypothetical protein [Acidobacteriaceae bacterium]
MAKPITHIALRADAMRIGSVDLLFKPGEPAQKELLSEYSDKSYSFPAHQKTTWSAATG